MATAAQAATKPQRLIYTRPWMYEKQSAAVFDPVRFSLIEATTKSGKTLGCAIWLAEQAMMGERGQDYWWVAPTHDMSKYGFDYLAYGLPKELYWSTKSPLQIGLLNGTALSFKSAEEPRHLYGQGVYAAVMDEASLVKEEAWWALRTTVTATQAPIRFIGNVRGRKNWFYRMCRKAESGEPDMAYHKLTWKDAVEAGIYPVEEAMAAKAQLPEAVFKELYEAEASDDQGNPFGAKYIKMCVAPMSDKEPVCWGWDLARSVAWTVGTGLDEDGQVCRFERFRAPWQETHNRIVKATGRTPALVDCTGIGDAPFERLRREGGSNFEGYLFSSSSKQKLMESLAVAIQRQEIFYPGGPIVSELELFEYEYTRTAIRYSAPEGCDDDCVCSLALAREKFQKCNQGIDLLV